MCHGLQVLSTLRRLKRSCDSYMYLMVQCEILAVDRGDKCNCKPHGIMQLAVETESVLHLLYTDAILSLKNSLFSHSATLVNVHSAVLQSLVETRRISSINCTFGTLFHISLECPERPLKLHPDTPRSLARRSRSDCARRGRKSHGSRPTRAAEPGLKMKMKLSLREETTNTSRQSFSATTPPTPVPLVVTEAHYPGWRPRRHSITAHNAPSCLPIAPPDRRLSRRFSFGLAVTPDETSRRTPFPATIMYGKIVFHLENTLEPGRHFHRMQRFGNCFCGTSMVDCLLGYCHTVLKSSIKREKAVEMCRRMLSHGVIENVSHRRQQDKEGMVFKGSRLYRFTGSHFWEEYSITSELDGASTSASMPSLTQPGGIKRQRASSVKKVYMSLSEGKTGFVRRCKSRFSLRGSHTI